MSALRKIWLILTPSQRKNAAWLAVLMAVGMLLEMLCVGLVVPAMAAMSGAQTAAQSATLLRIRQWFGQRDNADFLVAGLGLFFAVYAIKAAFLVYLAWMQARFASTLQSSLGNRLFATYLRQPWTFHLQHNSAELIHKATTEVQHFSIMVSALLSFVTETLVIIGIGGLLVAYEPSGALVTCALLGAATWLFQHLSRTRIDSWGVRNRDHGIQRAKHLQQGLHGAKDVKIFGCEAEFLDRFRRDDAVVAKMAGRLTVIYQLPRLWYELMAVAGLAVIGWVLIWQGYSGPRLLSRLGLFAAAAFRMMPSANRIMLTWQTLRYYKPSIDSVSKELALGDNDARASQHPIEFRESIEMVGVSFTYPGNVRPAVQNICLRIGKGRALGITGGSGAGKSTLVDVLLGLLSPDSGSVLVDGHDIKNCIRSWQGNIGYVPQAIFLTDDTICANVAFGVPSDDIDLDAVVRAINAAQMQDFVAALPHGLDTLIGERGVRLSGGQRQRIGIARALYRDPPILVLDEATSSLDTETEKEVMAAVNELHGVKTIIIVAHRLSTVSACDELIRLEDGRIVREGTYADVVRRS